MNVSFHAILSITSFTSQNINHIPDAHSCQDVQDIVDKLTVKAVSKIREYLLQKVYQFRKPLSNYQIPQNAMIKHKYDPVWNIESIQSMCKMLNIVDIYIYISYSCCRYGNLCCAWSTHFPPIFVFLTDLLPFLTYLLDIARFVSLTTTIRFNTQFVYSQVFL